MLQSTSASRLQLLAALAALALTAALATPAPAGAGIATLVTDLAPGRPGSNRPSTFDPPVLAALPAGRAAFLAEGQLWGSDGTAAGTLALHEFAAYPAPQLLGAVGKFALVVGDGRLWTTDGRPDGTVALVAVDPNRAAPLFALTAKLLVFTLCGDTGCALWKSDGTAAGTALLRAGLTARDLTAVGDKVFFVSDVPGSRALWTTDGTAAGTVVVHNFVGANAPPIEDGPVRLTAAADRLFFVAADDVFHGTELWVSDGTVAGTRAASNFATANPNLRTLKTSGKTVYFLADDVFHGTELWQSDGTVAGTRAVTDFAAADPFDDDQGTSFTADQLAKAGNRLLFATNRDRALWVSDGTPATTTRFDACGGPCGSVFTLAPAGDRVLFIAGNGTLWSTDGTVAGTRKLGTRAAMLFSVLGRAYYLTVLETPEFALALWTTDGTAAGTREIATVSALGETPSLVVSGSRTFFAAGAVGDSSGTFQIWTSEGTAPALPLTVFDHGGSSASPTQLTAFRDGVLFSARGSSWWSGGTAATTTPLPGFALGFTVVGDLAYYWSPAGLWRTDGTPGGTLQLPLPAGVAAVQAVAPLAGRALIVALSRQNQLSFLTSDGTPAGTVPLFDSPEPVFSSGPLRGNLAAGGRVYLRVLDRTGLETIWVSDGTPAGTGPLTPPSFLETRPELAAVGATVYFTAPASGRLALWKTDGTPAGTSLVYPATPPAPPRFVDVDHLVAFAGAIWFFANDSGTYSLYRSDGTAAGTRAVKAVSPGVKLAPTVAGNLLFFVGHDDATGDELWKSDGTAAGTVLVKDVRPGPAPSQPASLVAAGSTLFFSADDGRHGAELWQSDGTAAGTRLVDDVAPGPASAEPQELAVAGNQLFFSADDGVHGRELWVYPLAGPACQPSPTALCLAGGRFRVEAAWRTSRLLEGSGPGQAVALSADTGYFWFFSPGNVEVVVKVLDGRALNGHFWTFYGALSNVEYELTVTDTVTGAARRYVNPPGTLSSVGDTTSFGPQGAKNAGELLPGPPISPTSPASLATAGVLTSGRSSNIADIAAALCVAGPTRLCLNNGRFGVTVTWQDFQNRTGVGTAVPLTGDTGYFWFFDPGNVETVVKVLGPVDSRYWVFYGALSSVAYTLTVTDAETGAVRTYQNPKGRLASVADTGAF